MKALTVWQPWATLIMAGAKPYEFRPKSFRRYMNAPAIGERIVIHAGVRPVKPAEVEDLLERLGTDADKTGLVPDIARAVLERCRAAAKYQALPLGCALGSAKLGRPRNAGVIFTGLTADSDRQAADLQAFNWAWPLYDHKPFDAPVPYRGMQGFWNYPEGIAA